jgi:hypothetical protein
LSEGSDMEGGGDGWVTEVVMALLLLLLLLA